MATAKPETEAVKLTDQYLRSLAAPPKERMVWDAVVARFGVRLSPGGSKTFIIRYRHRGRQVRLVIGRFPALPLADARDQAKKKLAEVEQGRDPAQERRADREAPTFTALAAEYIEKY